MNELERVVFDFFIVHQEVQHDHIVSKELSIYLSNQLLIENQIHNSRVFFSNFLHQIVSLQFSNSQSKSKSISKINQRNKEIQTSSEDQRVRLSTVTTVEVVFEVTDFG